MKNCELEFDLEEVWRDIKGYEGMYQVSNLGRVRSLNYHSTHKPAILKFAQDDCGYWRCALSKHNKLTTFKVHRLVAIAFMPNGASLPQVNHINGDKQNNCVYNLEWCDNSHNQLHAWKTGLQPPYRERKLHSHIGEIVTMVRGGYKFTEIADFFHVHSGSISRYLRKHGFDELVKNKCGPRSRMVVASKDGNSAIFFSVKKAVEYYHFSYTRIQQAALANREYKGYLWSYYTRPNIQDFYKTYICKRKEEGH